MSDGRNYELWYDGVKFGNSPENQSAKLTGGSIINKRVGKG